MKTGILNQTKLPLPRTSLTGWVASYARKCMSEAGGVFI